MVVSVAGLVGRHGSVSYTSPNFPCRTLKQEDSLAWLPALPCTCGIWVCGVLADGGRSNTKRGERRSAPETECCFGSVVVYLQIDVLDRAVVLAGDCASCQCLLTRTWVR